jgi:hypothetical protein
MPGFNQKGPMGQGPMTGRRMGRCTNFGANPKDQSIPENETPDTTNPDNLAGRGMGLGRGRGNGLGRGRGGAGRGMGRQNRLRGGF